MDNLESKRFEIENGILKGCEKTIETGNANLGEKLLQVLKNNADFVGQVDAVTGEEYTYKEMADMSIKCSLWLREKGMKIGDVVGIFTHNHTTTFVPCLATLFNRGVVAPSFSGTSLDNLKYIIQLIEPRFVFAEEREAKLIQEIVREDKKEIEIITFTKILGFTCLQEILVEEKSEQVSNFICTEPISPEDKCFLIFTSGSSGEPKPTLHLYKSVMNVALICLELRISGKTVALNTSPLGWVTGLINMLIDIITFSKRVIIHEKGHKPEEIFGFITKYKVTNLILGIEKVYQFYISENCKNYDLSSVNKLTIGGTKINSKVLEFLRELLPNGNLQIGYGSTELLFLAFKSILNEENVDTCGFVMPGIQIKVIDPKNGKILQPNETGELCFKTPFTMKEYFKNPEATKQAIDEDGWYHSGDLGYFDNNGFGYIVGRKTNSSPIDDKNLILWKVERILLLHSSVVEVAVIFNSNSHIPEIFAFVTVVPGSKTTEAELSNIIKCLSINEVTVTVKIIKSMPVTFIGKVKYSVLRKMTESM